MSLWDRITGRTQTPEIEPDAPPASVMGASSPFSFLDLPSSVPIEFAYPSRDGYPVASPEEVIRAHYAHVDAAFRAFDQRSLLQGFDEDFAQLIHQFASFVSLLPASRQYHHHKPGGLFAHSLDVATKALHYSSGHIMNSDSDPRDREADEFAWSVSAFVAGLLHDIGKVETMGSIVARTMRSETPSFSSSSAPNRKYTWRPEVSPLTSWLAQYNIDTVYLNFTDEGDNRHIHLIHPYFFRIVPPSLRSLIFNANPSISKLFRKYLENPAATSTNTLCRLVSDADTQSVRFDRDPQGLPGAIDVNTLIIRRFLEFAAKEKYWNTPGSAFQHGLVEHINNGTRYYFELDFFICDEKNVAAFVRYLMDEDLFGNRLPTNIEEGVFEALLSHGVVTSTIPSILPVRLSDPRLPHYYPASLAKVRFSAKLEGGRGGVPTVHPIGHEPIVLDLPVLAISKSPVAGHRDHMPTLSFDGEPGTPTWPRPIRIEDGKLLPADDALDDDPVARQEIIEATGLDPDSDDPDEATTAAMMTRLRARRRALRKGATMLDGKEFGGRAAPSEDASPPSRPALSDEVPDQSATNEGHEAALVTGTDGDDIPDLPVAPPRSASEPPAAKPTRSPVAPSGASPWRALYCEDWDGDVAHFLAILWHYCEEDPKAPAAYRPTSDLPHYYLSVKALSGFRSGFAEAVRSAGLDHSVFSNNWPLTGFEQIVLKRYLKRSDDRKGFLQLYPAVVEIIERAAATEHEVSE